MLGFPDFENCTKLEVKINYNILAQLNHDHAHILPCIHNMLKSKYFQSRPFYFLNWDHSHTKSSVSIFNEGCPKLAVNELKIIILQVIMYVLLPLEDSLYACTAMLYRVLLAFSVYLIKDEATRN